jgi:hypothetical protein
VLLRDIIRSINKKIDYTAREGEGTRFTLHLKLRGHETDVALDLEDLKLATSRGMARTSLDSNRQNSYGHRQNPNLARSSGASVDHLGGSKGSITPAHSSRILFLMARRRSGQ